MLIALVRIGGRTHKEGQSETFARKSLVSLDDTPYYHVVARWVRRAWLWGFDDYAGRDYSHRKAWILERLVQLTSIFAIEICAYAVMSNHYHLVVHVNRSRARQWARDEVIERWTQLFSDPPIVARCMDGSGSEAEREIAESIIEIWRARLFDLSWFMKCLNEHLARRANIEDNCTGKFWRVDSNLRLCWTKRGLLTAMAYVAMRPRGNVFGRAMGRLDHLRLHAKVLGQSWVRGPYQAERMYRA